MDSSSLYVACGTNDVAVVQAAITDGKDLNVHECVGLTPLMIAINSESFDVMKLLVKQPSIRKDAVLFMGCTPLAWACFNNKEVDCILELIAAGCNINVANADDHYPITLLILNKHMDWKKKKTVIEVLIKNGVDLDKPKILEHFIQYYNHTEECLEILHLLLYYNIDVNANGVEPLTFALKQGHLDICDILWDYIADFTLNSNELLLWSLKHRYKFNELIEKGVEINEEMNFFETTYALFTLCVSDGVNVEMLNYVWTLFHSHDKIDNLIENVNLDIKEINLCFQAIPEGILVNRECVIRFFHLFFNFVFESKTDLFDSFDFYELYEVLEHIELEKDEMIQMFYLFLMCTTRISYDQLFSLYEKCPKDLFETFLKVNIKIIEDRYDIYEYTEFDYILYPDLLPLDMGYEDVPSLLKLSRNVIREHFQPTYETIIINEDFVYFRYYNKVNKLDVPKHIKDILLLNV